MKTKIGYIVSILFGVLLLFAIVLIAVLYKEIHSMQKDSEQLEVYFQKLSEQNSLTNDDLLSLREEHREKLMQILSLTNEITELKNELTHLKDERENLIKDGISKQNEYALLLVEIEELKESIDAKQADIDSIKNGLEQYSDFLQVDITQQIELINQLSDLLAAPPSHMDTVTRPAPTDKDPDATEEIQEEKESLVSVYYQDLTSGYSYSYHADDVFYSASLVKLPYVLSLLEKAGGAVNAAKAEAKENAIAAAWAAANGTMTPEQLRELENADTEYPYIFPPAYDFDAMKITYTNALYKKGSGIIKNSEPGTEYNYGQLVDYTLLYSDNVAYALLKEKYGFTDFFELCERVGARSPLRSMRNLTAREAGAIMAEAYRFIESDDFFAPKFSNALENANYAVLIPPAVKASKVLHKYGWDDEAYHDMAIVYNSKSPYVLVILSDMDDGSDQAISYFRNIASLVDEMHRNFYKQK